MKIRKLKIKNYKIFDDVEFDFTDADSKTLDTIVLAGVNGCGKTTVLEVIGLVLSLRKRMWGIDSELEKAEIEIKVELDEDNGNASMISQMVPEFLKADGFYNFGLKTNNNHILPVRTVYFPVSEKTKSTEKVIVVNLSLQKDEMKQLVLKNLRDEVLKTGTYHRNRLSWLKSKALRRYYPTSTSTPAS